MGWLMGWFGVGVVVVVAVAVGVGVVGGFAVAVGVRIAVVVEINKIILPKNYTCLACLQLRRDGVCVKRQIIAMGKCKLYDPILGRHELHKKITGK